MASQPTLTCKECNYENEIQRIHCHQCGRKLDRSAAFEEEQRKKNERDQTRRAQARNRTSGGSSSSLLGTLISILFRAAITAALILAALPPAKIPPSEPQFNSVNAQAALTSIAGAPVGKQLLLPAESINEFFRTTIRRESRAIPFQRLFATLEDGAISFTLQHGWPQYSLYNGISYTLEIKEDTLVATPVRANVGRLNLPAPVAKYAERLFTPFWKNMDPERDQMNMLKSVEIRKDGLLLTAKGTATPTSTARLP